MPASVTLDAGQKVTIRNTGRGFHNVHWEDRSVPELAPSQSEWQTERTFNAPGEYRFYCDPHKDDGMRGTVVVNEAAGTTTPTPTDTTGTTTSTTPADTTTTTTPRRPPDATAPRAPIARAAATRRGVTVRLTLSEPASVTVRVLRRTGGSRAGRSPSHARRR